MSKKELWPVVDTEGNTIGYLPAPRCVHASATPKSNASSKYGNPYSSHYFCDECGIEVEGDGPDHEGRETWTMK